MYRITTEPPDLMGVPEAAGFRSLISECLAKYPADRPGLAAIMGRLAEAASPAGAVPAELAETVRPGAAGQRGGAGADNDRAGGPWPEMLYEPTRPCGPATRRHPVRAGTLTWTVPATS